MRIALVGYGKMGRMIERIAATRGHEISARLDIDNNVRGEGLTAETLSGTNVAIEFSTPDAVLGNLRRLVALRMPTVVGTTGWFASLDEIQRLVVENNAALVYSANYSIGMNLFMRLARDAARLFSRHSEYDPVLVEHHHKFKVDAPSGTAIVIEKLMQESYTGSMPSAVSIRGGYAPGTHEVLFDSEADTIALTHTARSREGFALGAILAAERIVAKQGCFEFSRLLFEDEEEK